MKLTYAHASNWGVSLHSDFGDNELITNLFQSPFQITPNPPHRGGEAGNPYPYLGGGVVALDGHSRAMSGILVLTLNLKIKPNTTRARPLGLGKHRHKVLGLGRARLMGLGLVFGV